MSEKSTEKTNVKSTEKSAEKSTKKTKRQKAKISYQNDFYSDLSFENTLIAKVVRCPAQKGIIKSVSHPNLPDDYFLITARDVPGSNIIDTVGGKISVFCNGNISYLGEPIGLLVGPNSDIIDALMKELVIEIDKNSIEDYLTESDESESSDEKIDAENKDKNLNEKNSLNQKSAKAASVKSATLNSSNSKSLEKTKISKKSKILSKTQELNSDFFSDEIASRQVLWPKNCDLEKIFESSANVIEQDYSYSLNIPNYGETNGALCSLKDGILTVYTPTQWIFDLRYMLSKTLNLKSESINIKRTKTYNRGSNSIWYNSVIACQVATATLKTKKSVKLVYTRQEQNNFIDAVRPILIKHKTAADENGKIKAMQVDIDVDAGFLNPFAQEIIDRLVIAATGDVKPEALKISAKIHKSKNPSSSVDIKLIDSAAFFAVENQLNLIAAKSNLTPAELRLINGISENNLKSKKSSSSKKSNYPFLIELDKYSECINAATRISDFNRRYASYQVDSQDGRAKNLNYKYDIIRSSPLRGIGFACGWAGSAYFGSKLNESEQSMELILDEDSNVIIHCPPISHSIFEIWTKIICETLDINPSQVKLNTEFEPGNEPLLPENIYSSISIMTSLLKKCLVQIKKCDEKTPKPFVVKRKLSPSQKKKWNSETFSGKPFYKTSFGVAVLELELDACTFREKIRSITLVLNAGKVINIKSAENSVKLSVQKIMQSLVENDFVEYPKININFMQSDEEPMRVSDLVFQILPAAYTQALTQVLNCCINVIPLQSDTIYYKLEEQKILEHSKQIEKNINAVDDKNFDDSKILAKKNFAEKIFANKNSSDKNFVERIFADKTSDSKTLSEKISAEKNSQNSNEDFGSLEEVQEKTQEIKNDNSNNS